MNKRLLAFLSVVLAAGVSFAAVEPIYELVSTLRPTWFQKGIYIGDDSQNPRIISDTQNKITRALGGSIVFDFGSATITCLDSTGITVPGAKLGDPCFASPNIAWAANQEFSCYVSAANTVIVRFCAAGTAADPASATYNVRVLSNQ